MVGLGEERWGGLKASSTAARKGNRFNTGEGSIRRLIFRSVFCTFSITAFSSPGSTPLSFRLLTTAVRLAERRMAYLNENSNELLHFTLKSICNAGKKGVEKGSGPLIQLLERSGFFLLAKYSQ